MFALAVAAALPVPAHAIVVQTASARPSSPILSYPLNSPPINGFVPYLVFGMTREQDRSGELLGMAVPSSFPEIDSELPSAGNAKYVVGIFDTGSQSHLLSYAAGVDFQFDQNFLYGEGTQQVIGAGGPHNPETVDMLDALGYYVTGLANASVNASGQLQTSGIMRGHWNVAGLVSRPNSALPNIIGGPIAAQYRVVISNDNTRRLTVNDKTYRSPQVSLESFADTPPDGFLTLDLEYPANAAPGDPVYFPNFFNFDNPADDPLTPSSAALAQARVNGAHNDERNGAPRSLSNAPFLFDTGAQVTVLSESSAASLGYYSAVGPNGEPKSTPDFTVEVSGVGGSVLHVPGFYLNQLSVTTNGGDMTWTNVPVLVLNLPDIDGSGFLPGILGMNLFTDRDLAVNMDALTPYVGIGQTITPQWRNNADGIWGSDDNWRLGVPDAASAPDSPDLPANFLSSITAPRTVTVEADYTFGSMKFDNANRYTIAGPGHLTLQNSTGLATITVATGSHTIAAPLTLATDTTVTITPPSSTLTISGPLSAPGKTLTKSGAGQLQLAQTTAGTLAIQQGSVQFLPALATPIHLDALTLAPGTTLDLTTNTLQIAGTPGAHPALISLLASAYAHGAWNLPGITSTTARDNPAHSTTLAYADDGATLTIKYTWYGDLNLDGLVNSADRAALDAALLSPAGTHTWSTGDLNYDGKLTPDDLALFSLGASLSAGANINTFIPEPSALLACAAVVRGASARRRRNAV